ncbi:MAG: FAD:protein FMN transferase [Thermodesulfovibrionia bacterium]
MFRESRVAMDTITTITVVSSSEERAKRAIDAGFGEIKRLEGLLNYFSPDSEVTVINNHAGIGPVKVSRETIEVIKRSLQIAEMSNGAFNPTIGPVIRLWRFSRQDRGDTIPSDEAIKDALKLVDYKKIKINEDNSEVYLEMKGMEIDLGGIAKGYAADKAVDVIKGMGMEAGLVAIAGDIKGFGLRPDGLPWHVGIQDPRSEKGDTDEVFATIYLKDSAISTSGDYQRFFIKDGKRYHHIIDPKTGYPSGSSIINISVIADDGFMTDGLSTAMFIYPPQEAIDILESLGLEGIIVDNQKMVYATKGLKYEITNRGYRIASHLSRH